MNKGLEALERLVYAITHDVNAYSQYLFSQKYIDKDKEVVAKELKALEIINQNFRLVGNCLHARNPYAEDGWVFVKEIEDEEELEAWKEVLL